MNLNTIELSPAVEAYMRLIEVAYELPPQQGAKQHKLSRQLRDAIKEGWKSAWSLVFDEPGRPLVSRLAKHHRDAIKWHWVSRHRICRMQVDLQNAERSLSSGRITESEFESLTSEIKVRHRLRHYAYFPIWSRGHMKSAIARRIAVMDAIISMYYGVGGYCLYFSGTQDKTDKHAISIERILRSTAIQTHAPLMAEAKRSEEGSRQLGWRATMFYTAAGYVYHFGSLQSGMAGGNIENLRPTIMIPDDIDSRNTGPLVAEKNLRTLTTEILPMGSQGTLTFWAQNYIDDLSVMYRIHTGQVRVLVNRKRSVPIPAIEGLETEVRTVNGELRDVIVAGTPTWPYFGIEECQDELNRMGLDAFLRECQHEVEQSNEGRVIRTYDDDIHAISESEFASVFGSKDAWKLWGKVVFNDWARTKTARHANVAGYIAVSSQNTRFPGAVFIIPRSYPADSMAEDVAVDLLSILEPEAKDGWTWRRIVDEALRRAGAGSHFESLKDRVDYERSQIKAVIPKYSRPMLTRCRVIAGAMSHSEDTIRALYNDVFGFSFIPSNPGMTDAVEQIIHAFKVDRSTPHRFRPEQKGFTRTYIVCTDDVSTEPKIRNGVKTYPPLPFPKAITPDDLHHSDLCRYQMVKWSWADPLLSARGERIDVIRKENDDFPQSLQMVWFKDLLSQIKLTKDEMQELALPESFRAETIAATRDKMTDDEYSRTVLTRQVKQVLPKILTPKKRPATGIGRFKR